MLRTILTVAFLTFAGGLAPAQEAFRADLEVELKYGGSTEVDSGHRLYVFVFNTPNFSTGAMPIGMGMADSNGETIKLVGLSASPVYVVSVFDEEGTYDPTAGPPPQGAPVGMYASGGQPAPIELNPEETTLIELSFDDSTRMP